MTLFTLYGARASFGAIVLKDILDREITLEHPAEKVALTFNFEEYFAAADRRVSKIAGWARA
ncbi:MAG: hypothetical protein LBT65_01750 [Synergistaceae bacterium]|jgi:iron complex transport system substrate-binding protein|nr:hypothetical protein [Synergistaceae bacterium]